MPTTEQMIDSYERHKNLKIAASDLGISLQTLYYHLKRNNVDVSGDKERYGSEKDRFGVLAERLFAQIVPFATDNNSTRFQAKVDFLVRGTRIDVKAAKRQSLGVGAGGDRWAFSIKKQKSDADFYVMFAFDKEANLEKIFLVPGELIHSLSSISISANGKSKWHAYEVSKEVLHHIFLDIAESQSEECAQ